MWFGGAVRYGAAEAGGEQRAQGLGHQASGHAASPGRAGEPREGCGQGKGRGSARVHAEWIAGEELEAGRPEGQWAKGPREERVR